MADASPFGALDRALERCVARIAKLDDPLARAVAFGQLIEHLQQRVTDVAAGRDDAIAEVLARPDRPSHRALAQQLGVSAQRVDQLARLARHRRAE